MECTGYYRVQDYSQNEFVDMDEPLLVNCTGRMNKIDSFIGDGRRPDFYLLYITDGIMTANIEGNKIPVKAGMGIVYYPNSHYEYSFTNECSYISYYWVHFTGNQAEILLKRFGLEDKAIFNIGVHNSIINLFDKMAYEIIGRKDDFAFAAASYIPQILFHIKRYSIPDKKQKLRHLLNNSIEYINQNFNQDISVEKLSEMDNFSPSRYRVVFKELTGLSPKNYVTGLRLRTACQYLRQTNFPLTMISELCGYENQTYFCRIFKKELKTTPSQYRKTFHKIN